jgi:CTP:molybdopterin cytidylyltransferase MocA
LPAKVAKSKVFISYASKHFSAAQQLDAALRAANLESVFAPEALKNEISEDGSLTASGNVILIGLLQSCDAVVFLLAEDFIRSRYCQLERGAFLGAVGDPRRAQPPIGIVVELEPIVDHNLELPDVHFIPAHDQPDWVGTVLRVLTQPPPGADIGVIERQAEAIAAAALTAEPGKDVLKRPALDIRYRSPLQEGVVFVKPPASGQLSAIRRIARRLLTEGVNIVQLRRFTGKMVRTGIYPGRQFARGSLFDDHYFGPLSIVREDPPELTPEERQRIETIYAERWMERFGQPWRERTLVGAAALLQRPVGWPPDRVTTCWERGRIPELWRNGRVDGLNKIGAQKSVFPIEVNGEWRLVLNGYVFGYQKLLQEPEGEVRVVAFRVATDQPWDRIRDDVLGGDSDPRRCLPTSLRRQAADDPLAFGLKPEALDGQRNLLHSSASALEGVREIRIWFDRSYADTHLGYFLTQRLGLDALQKLVFDVNSLLANARDKQLDELYEEFLRLAAPPGPEKEREGEEAFRQALLEALAEKFKGMFGRQEGIPDEILFAELRRARAIKDLVFFSFWVHEVGLRVFVSRFIRHFANFAPDADTSFFQVHASHLTELVQTLAPRRGDTPEVEIVSLAAAVVCSDLMILANGSYPADFVHDFLDDLPARAIQIAERIRSNALKAVATRLLERPNPDPCELRDHPKVKDLRLRPIAVNVGRGLPDLVVLIAAGGRSTRVQSIIPKPVLRIDGQFIVDAIANNVKRAFGQKRLQIFLSIGWERELIRACLGDRYRYLTLPDGPDGDNRHAGLGPAVRLWAALHQLQSYDGTVIACYADMPFVEPDSLGRLLAASEGLGSEGLAMLTADEAPVAGRVVRGPDNSVRRVDHERTVRQPADTTERDVGFYAFRNVRRVRDALGRIRNDNIKHEYGIHQLVEEVVSAGGRVESVKVACSECWTINDAADLGWLGLGGHRARPNTDWRIVYEEFKRHYGATFTFEEFEPIRTLVHRVVHPDHSPRPHAPLHFLIDLIKSTEPS